MCQSNKNPKKGLQDEVIQVHEAHDRVREGATNAKAKASKVEILAKLYLDGNSADISGVTIAELCDWLWSEFQSIPLNIEFSWYERYSNVAEMFADIAQNHLWVSAENYDTTLGLNPIYNFIFQAMHDNDHYRTHSDFSLEGEITTYKSTAKRAPSLNVQKILYSESVLRTAARIFLGHTPISKIVFA